MRQLIIILLTGLFASCSGDKEPIQRLGEFEYPLDSLSRGKIFVYKNKSDGEYYYVEQKRITESGIDFIIQETYSKDQRVSAEKYKITDTSKELIESYLYSYPDSLSKSFIKDKAEVYEFKNLKGQKYRGTYSELRIITSSNIKATVTTKEEFKNEGKLKINNQILDVLIFTSDIKTTARHRYIPFFSSETVYTGEHTYAKQIGLIKYTTNTDTESSEWELVDIKNIE